MGKLLEVSSEIFSSKSRSFLFSIPVQTSSFPLATVLRSITDFVLQVSVGESHIPFISKAEINGVNYFNSFYARVTSERRKGNLRSYDFSPQQLEES